MDIEGELKDLPPGVDGGAQRSQGTIRVARIDLKILAEIIEDRTISVERAQEIIVEMGGKIQPILHPGRHVCIGLIPIEGGRKASVFSDGSVSYTSSLGGEVVTLPGSHLFPWRVRW